ncbi:MAG: hypothetical protein ACQESR_28970 [Planctomycetota bacterium]
MSVETYLNSFWLESPVNSFRIAWRTPTEQAHLRSRFDELAWHEGFELDANAFTPRAEDGYPSRNSIR